MRDFPSCFGENGVQVADFSSSPSSNLSVSKASQNTVTCIYVCTLFGESCSVTIVWSKNLIGQCLSVEIEETSCGFVSKFDVKPSLFFKRKGSKCLSLNSGKNRIQVFWDLSSAKFGPGPEPVSSYYVAIACGCGVALLIGDLADEAFRKAGGKDVVRGSSVLVSRREHVFGKSVFATKARFWDEGRTHDLKIECDTSCGQDPVLVVRVDTKTVMQVKRLRWKFRGNFVITVDGVPVEVFWDVHNWLFGMGLGSAVFMFRTGLLSGEKMWAGHSGCESSVVDWRCSGESESTGFGFSFFLYAWKNE